MPILRNMETINQYYDIYNTSEKLKWDCFPFFLLTLYVGLTFMRFLLTKKQKSFLNLTSYKLSYQKLFSLICKSYYTSVILLPSSWNNIAIFQAITSFKSDHSHIIRIRKLYRDGVLLFEDKTKRTIWLQLI